MIIKMTDGILYGEHLFPCGPMPFFQTANSKVEHKTPSQYTENDMAYVLEHNQKPHDKLAWALSSAFSSCNPDSILHQLPNVELNQREDAKVSFINYGNMQLIYLATLEDKSQIAVSINQPKTPMGRVKKEFENLQRLSEIDPNFMANPLAYFNAEEFGHEIYASEYIEDAMCVAVNEGKHGVYCPKPEYRFENFSPDVSRAVNANMIALLVNYYDTEKNRGLSGVKTGGGDFVLAKYFDKEDVSGVQPNMKVVAARDFVSASLDEYIDILRREFATGAVQNGAIVNVDSRLPIMREDIERGIESGLEMRLGNLK